MHIDFIYQHLQEKQSRYREQAMLERQLPKVSARHNLAQFLRDAADKLEPLPKHNQSLNERIC